MATDSNNNIFYTIDSEIKKIDTNGIWQHFAGSIYGEIDDIDGPIEPLDPTDVYNRAHFNYLTGIAVDGDDNIIVSDYGNRKIKEIINHYVYTIAGGEDEEEEKLDRPFGIAVNNSGYIAIADDNKVKIKVISSKMNIKSAVEF